MCVRLSRELCHELCALEPAPARAAERTDALHALFVAPRATRLGEWQWGCHKYEEGCVATQFSEQAVLLRICGHRRVRI